jgi:hypothetical protein
MTDWFARPVLHVTDVEATIQTAISSSSTTRARLHPARWFRPAQPITLSRNPRIAAYLAAASICGGLAPLMTSHNMKAISPRISGWK